jgi:hypothetical protein
VVLVVELEVALVALLVLLAGTVALEVPLVVALLLPLVALEVAFVELSVELAGAVALLVSLLGVMLSLVEFPTDVALETGVAVQDKTLS